MLEREDGRYAATPETALFLDRTSPAYVGGLLEMANARLYPFWGSLTEALRTGRPQNEAKHGEDFFTALYADQERLRQFMRSMTALSSGAARAIAQQFPWERHHVLVDLGCAEGGLPVTVAQAHAHIRGGGFDLPPVRALFEAYVEAAGLSDRLRFHPGDFFADPLPPADVYTLGHVLHDWAVEDRRALLRKVHDALPDGGAVIVFDAVIDDERRTNAFGLLMSLNMLIETPGGGDYTGAECCAWLREAGFREAYVEHLAGPDSMVVGIR
jgi:cyclopropane fatty-acyl-phospholipid synthase-like methyltransferase